MEGQVDYFVNTMAGIGYEFVVLTHLLEDRSEEPTPLPARGDMLTGFYSILGQITDWAEAADYRPFRYVDIIYVLEIAARFLKSADAPSSARETFARVCELVERRDEMGYAIPAVQQYSIDLDAAAFHLKVTEYSMAREDAELLALAWPEPSQPIEDA
jgi:hypothetical protein